MPLPLSTWLNFPLDTCCLILPTTSQCPSCLGTFLYTPIYLQVGANTATKAGIKDFTKGVIASNGEWRTDK
ncbi:hypothetical protein VF14_01395 [Nostoc linckia z18]|uniref:Uncharacterized protein n=3 Tax=Nostoc TaxID=1177 RepID=A0A9Q5ZHH2_NOSLI|nr:MULTISPECIES: hypothetical protein [Nostoc]MBC1238553.1 hypothetical protein [Nostoc sp. 2RC]MDZ8014730.1 hypothetical protein [Nostoc sp. ZfuVER08]PHJ77500.1 hypothetical protein VF03_04555 [Nostoc linckia z2]PHJ86424.1 hypothetical protein VF06_02745 [Nostoc linckia z4]PHJ91196.1 hypothetical protein VF07_05745 [Nostoc linckia z6]PHJ99108.1 hypothetical protein VF04_07560 [Nostoc linckia z7]PHK11977.1 hypothetical protein VF09_04845 [Nostoc linckia z9]PHK33327.1 hypothetical protein VF